VAGSVAPTVGLVGVDQLGALAERSRVGRPRAAGAPVSPSAAAHDMITG
jgi:hypothetical protein